MCLCGRRLLQVQAHLEKSGQIIKVTSKVYIPLDEYPSLFKYKIYECFKPTDLKQTRNYIEFLTTN